MTAYATEQFRLPQYSATLFGGSVGPRFFIPQNFINAFSVHPYLTGAVSTLGSTNYLNAGGGGVGFRGEFASGVSLEPGVELRSLWVNRELNTGGGGYFPFGFRPYSTLSTIATGDVVTGYVAGNYALNDRISFEGRGAYSRANANFAPQSSDQVDLQSMVKFDIDPPNVAIPRRWTVAPYGRFTHLAFDAAKPLVNPFIARRDAAWTGGVLLDAPITEMFGFAGNVEYSRDISNISNFSMQNLSVSFGPTAKFWAGNASMKIYTPIRIVASLALCAATASPARAEKVGAVGAVNQSAQGTPPGGNTRALAVGNGVENRERIETSASGSAQIVFDDWSTVTVGRNSAVTIDEFVCKEASGRQGVSLAKGVMRFVGGGVSHEGGTGVRAPTASSGVRGGSMMARVGGVCATLVVHQ